ncbi:MAG: DEAD/DEAH box helicase [Vicingaceae bacterium]
MSENLSQKSLKTTVLYPYQKSLVHSIFERLREIESGTNLLFQLPTGGGKTLIFSEIAKKYVNEHKKKVLILTHRVELLVQTSGVLNHVGLGTKIIDSQVHDIPDQTNYKCFVAMVETLNNRLLDNECYLDDIGLVIVDEAHYNSFRKIFQYFTDTNILGVTATPLSSNKNLPLNENYNELIVGDSIADLIDSGYLCAATTYTYSVNLKSLTVGISGDFTVSSSERVYGRDHMQQILLQAFEEKSKGKKTLIFNAGIATSIKVYELFLAHGYTNIKHLDSTFSSQERRDVLTWFRNTPDGILTSVGILTTGFDEPSVESIILNRATRSITLYHQMIGRGSRVLEGKDHFSIIDLGNNALRLGYWQDYIDWRDVFKNPIKYIDRDYERDVEERAYVVPEDIKQRFSNWHDEDFDVQVVYKHCVKTGIKPKKVVDESMENHFQLIMDNTMHYNEALDLLNLLRDEISHRLKVFTKCINGSDNYATWLIKEYTEKLKRKLWHALNGVL